MSEFKKPFYILSSCDKDEDFLVHSLSETHITTSRPNDYHNDVLKRLECPYNWKLDDIKQPPGLIRDVRMKLFELSEESKDSYLFHWNRCCIEVLLSYLLTNNSEFTEATELLNKLIDILKELEDTSCDEPFFAKTKDSLWHAIFASQIFILLKSGGSIDDDSVKKVMKKIKDISNITDEQKGAFLGMKTIMLLQYGHDGNILAVESAKMAKDLDPEMAEWWFLIGKAMGRIRRVIDRFECIDKEEVKMLEKAIELDDNPSYIIFLAQTYMECAKRAFQKFRTQLDLKTHDLGKHIDTLNEKSLNLFMRGLEKKPTCPRLLSRCANGLLRLPVPYKKPKLAEELLMKSLTINPNNSYTNHVAGYLYQNIYPFFDFEKALRYYEKASELRNYGASVDMIRLRNVLNPSYDPYDDLLKLRELYPQEVYQTFLDCETGSYFLFKKRDLLKALQYYSEILKKEMVSALKRSFSCVVNVNEPLNLLKIALDEARLARQNIESLSKEDKASIRKFIILVTAHAPDLLDDEPKENQIEEIVQKSQNKTAADLLKNSAKGRKNTRPIKQYEQSQGNQQKNWKSQFGMRKSIDEARCGKGYREEPLTRDARSNYKQQNWRREEQDTSNWRLQADNKGSNNQRQQNNACNKDQEQLQNCCWRTERRLNNKNEPTDFMTKTNDKEENKNNPYKRGDNRGHVKSRAENNFTQQNWRSGERGRTNWRSQADNKDSYERQHVAGKNKSELSDEKETYRFPVKVVPKE